MSALRIHDTRQKRKVPFVPLREGKVGIYVCGVTVYDLCHVGHARTSLAFDVIVRHLRGRGFDVTYVRNITDVDDKIIRRAQGEGRASEEVARQYADAMAEDLAALGVAPPDIEPRATTHIAEIETLIGRLVDKGLAYPSGGDVYFRVPSFPAYGSLSGQSIDDLRAGARIEVDEQKESPLDFALWKGEKPGEPSWSSPWGPGRPGWHIECSAMAGKHLGETFDIHGGGTDLIFPHHENENAQSQGAFGPDSFARYWLHSGMVTFGGEKMSKSLGNVVGIRRIKESHDLESLRLLYLGVHYRSPVGFEIRKDGERQSFPDLDAAEERLEYFYRTLDRLDGEAPAAGGAPAPSDVLEAARTVLPRFGEAMDDDFNAAAAVGGLYEAFVLGNKLLDDPKSAPKAARRATLAALGRDLRAAGATLGLFGRPASEFLLARRQRVCGRRGIDPAAVEARIRERTAARGARDFQRADEIRAELRGRGVELMDGPAGTTWRVV